MRISIPGASQQAQLGNLVVEIVGRVQAINAIEPRVSAASNKLMPAYLEIAVSTPTGLFALNAYEPELAASLETDEKYGFLCEIENDTYNKAKQPRCKVLGVRVAPKNAPPAPAPKDAPKP